MFKDFQSEFNTWPLLCLLAKQVAFSASLIAHGHGFIGPVNKHTTLMFKHVITNIGKAYNPHTGT